MLRGVFHHFRDAGRGAGPSVADALTAIVAYAPAQAEQGTPALSVVVTDSTHIVKMLALGYANVDVKTPVTPQPIFRSFRLRSR